MNWSTILDRLPVRRSHLAYLVVAVSVIVLIQVPAVWLDRAERLLLDPVELGDLPSWYGMLSGLGVAIWIASGCCAWLASISPTIEPAFRRALRSVGTVSILLGIDDLARFHEVTAEFLGVSEALVFALYLPVFAWLILRSFRELMPEAFLLALAAIGFALSLTLDLVVEEALGWYFEDTLLYEVLMEENAKLLGIVCWAGALTMASVRAVRRGGRPV